MALLHGSEHYTKWMHVENGNSIVRRIHRIEVQARDGKLYILTGERLPDCILTNTGVGFRGRHVAQILLNPKDHSSTVERLPAQPWPSWRDVVNVGLGFLAVVMLRYFATVIANL